MRKILAIFQKTVKDMLKNKRALLVFFIFPVMTLVFYQMMPDAREYFSTIFIPMHLMMVPGSIMASIIAEEKEKNTLKSLIMANVKPYEYFIGIGLFVLLISLASTSLFLITMTITAVELVTFYVAITLGTLCSMVIGSVIGISTENQISANAMITPVAIILGIIPMFSEFNETVRKISSVLYTQTLSNILPSLSQGVSAKEYLILAANFAICIVVFAVIYRRKRLDN